MAGEYSIKFIAKKGWSITKQDVNQNSIDNNDSDANPQTGMTKTTILDNAEQDMSWDAGMYQTQRPKIEIKKITNGGKISNIVVGDPIKWTYIITNSGNVNLTDIEVIDNKEGVVVCPQSTLAIKEQMECELLGSAVLGYYENNATVTALNGDGDKIEATSSSFYTGKDAPVELGGLGDKVWLDINRDGIQGDGEPGVASIKVTLYDVNKKVIATTKTNQNGNYFFEELEPNEYRVGFELPKGYKVTKENIGNDELDSDVNVEALSPLVTVVANKSNLTVDMGIYQAPAKLGNLVWYDSNQNGIQDNQESGIEGIEVKVYNQNNNMVAKTVTNAKGQYLFNNLAPNKYRVEFTVPNSYIVSPKDNGGNDSSDSDCDSSGKTDTITLNATQENNTVDMGLYQNPVKLGDRVWYDINKNGIQDGNEGGVNNVVVELYTKDGKMVAQTKTDNSGLYMFDNLIPTDYYLIFIPPAGYIITSKDKGEDDTKDSDVNGMGKTDIITLVSGKNNASVDMGLYQRRVSLGDRVWFDVNNNGIQDIAENGVKDINVTLHGVNGVVSSMLTDENGNYLFTNIAPGDYFVEFNSFPNEYVLTKKSEGDDNNKDSDVYIDSNKKFVTEELTLKSGDTILSLDMGLSKIAICPATQSAVGDLVWNDINKDGIQNIGEAGIEGIKINIYDYNTDKKVASTTTDSNGYYEFNNLMPTEYYIVLDVPKGYAVSPQNQADSDALDSDIDEVGRTDVFKLQAGKVKTTLDMGIYQKGSTVGDRVWYDENANGIQDSNEIGVNGVMVTLLKGSIEIATVKTNVSGEYRFTNVEAGEYRLLFSNLPSGYIFTNSKQNQDDSVDSDVNNNGETKEFKVPTGVDITTIDAGIRKFDIPTGKADIVVGSNGNGVTIDVLENDKGGTYTFDISTIKISSALENAIISEDGKKITIAGEGVWSVDLKTGEIKFTPEAGFRGDPTPISYTVNDTQGNQSGSEVKVNYPPVANDDTINASVDQAVVINILDNDKATSSPLDTSSVRIYDPINETKVESLEVLGEGIWSVNSDGTITFTPESSFSAEPTPIKYSVKEELGDESNQATVKISYPNAVDDELIIQAGQSDSITIDVLVNDSMDVVVDSLLIGCQDKGVKELNVEGEGVWQVNNNGTITFTPKAGFTAEPTPIKYTVALKSGERSNCATVRFRYALLAVNDTAILNIDKPTTIEILKNDRGAIVKSTVHLVIPKDVTTAMSLSDDRKTITVAGEGVWSVNKEGIVTFTIESGFKGVPTPIRYTVEDSNSNISNQATIVITKETKEIEQLQAVDDNANANGDNSIIIEVLQNDKGDIDPTTVLLIEPKGEKGKEIGISGEGVWSVKDSGVVTFTPEDGYKGTPTAMLYVVSDKNGKESNTATITITGECICEDYQSDATPSLAIWAEILLLLLMTLLGGVYFREWRISIE